MLVSGSSEHFLEYVVPVELQTQTTHCFFEVITLINLEYLSPLLPSLYLKGLTGPLLQD